MRFINNQRGVVPVFFLLSALGIIIYILISSTLPFKDKLFSLLFPKPPSYAATSTDTQYNMGVLVIKYFPLTSNGQNIDISVTGDVGESYAIVKKRTDDVTNQLKISLEKASTYLGYKDPNAVPSLKYTIIDTKEYTQMVPILNDGKRTPDYNNIMLSHNICDYVDNKGVTEVWLWAYQGPNYPGLQTPYLNISESKMAGPYGDISNSPRLNNMPVCKKTYRVYTFNFQRYTSEALESWGHQIEAEMDAVDRSLYRDKFQGPKYPNCNPDDPSYNQTTQGNPIYGDTTSREICLQNKGDGIGRCGSVHNPPNARTEYDRNNPNTNKSDCLDWKPDSLGTLSDISCSNWGCQDIDPINNNASLNYQIWTLQNMPGKGNTKTYQGKPLRNWWDIHGDFDKVMGSDKTLTFIPISTPTPTPTTAPSLTPTPASSPSVSPSPVQTSATFKLVADTSASSFSVGSSIPVKVFARSDNDASNLFSAKLTFPKDILSVEGIYTAGSFIGDGNWVEQIFDNNAGTISIIGGVKNPGYKTSGDVLYATIVFKALKSGSTTIGISSTSEIFRNSDNINIFSLTDSKGATLNIVPTASPAPSPSPSPTTIPTPSLSPQPSSSPNPTDCILGSASWRIIKNPIIDGTLIGLQVSGSSGCYGKKVLFNVKKDNGLLPAESVSFNPQPAIFQTDTISSNWIAEYKPNGPLGILDPPSYYFRVNLEGMNNTIKSSDPELNVEKAQFVKGDNNRDGTFSLADLSVLLTNFNKLSGFPPEADINDDGQINSFDYSVMLEVLRRKSIISR